MNLEDVVRNSDLPTKTKGEIMHIWRCIKNNKASKRVRIYDSGEDIGNKTIEIIRSKRYKVSWRKPVSIGCFTTYAYWEISWGDSP